MLLHGATVVPVKGRYDDAFRLSLEYTKHKGGLNRNTAYHPLTIEGKKSVALEIFTQLDGTAPDTVFVPVGDGVILAAVHKGFKDLLHIGLIDRLPRLACIQADSSDAIHNFIQTGRYRNAPAPNTIADSISVSAPSNAWWARRAVQESGGFSLTVSDEEILSAQKLLARGAGVFAEPAASAAMAGLLKAAESGGFDLSGTTVVLATGNGLKDVDAALKGVSMPEAVEPRLDALPPDLEKLA